MILKKINIFINNILKNRREILFKLNDDDLTELIIDFIYYLKMTSPVEYKRVVETDFNKNDEDLFIKYLMYLNGDLKLKETKEILILKEIVNIDRYIKLYLLKWVNPRKKK